ncbi:matrix metalloproteinase-2 [Cydia strobilella]|uniref:matrix metalloproteinase-2 n=1 Tax=Cydia strobilella TaxID=1100964 RepID=UPI00300426A8
MSPAAQGRCPTHQNSERTPETLDPVSPNMEPVTSKPSNNAMDTSIESKNENHSIDNLENELIDLDRCITPKCKCQNNLRRESCTQTNQYDIMLRNEDVHRESISVKRVSSLYGNTVWAANLKWKCSLEWTKVCNTMRVRARAISVMAMLLALATAGAAAPARARPTRSASNDKFVTDYLQKFGYLQTGRPEVQNLVSGAAAEYYEDDFRIAIKTLQEFGGIPVTGEVDEATKELLSKRRCGRPDREGYEENSTRKKRFAFQGATWKHTNLTWSLSSTRRPAALSAYGTRSVLARALDVWEQASRLTFTEINSDDADIVVSFARGQHGDAYAFDGRGSILAHAFFPGSGHGGDAHFDDDELWLLQPKNEDEEGTSLFAVAAHEFGHSLGLSHSAVKGALMFPWYQGIQPNFVLPADDRNGIQQMYGPKEKRVWGKIPNWTPPRRTPPTTTTTTTTTTRRPHHHHPHHNPNWPHHHPQNPTFPTYYPEKPQRPYIPERPHRNSSEEYPQRPHPRPRPTPPATRPTSYRPRYPTTRPEYPTYPRQNPTRPYPNKPAYHPEKPTAKPMPSDKPDTCDTSYDAVALIRGELFIFKNRYHWRIGAHGRYKEYPIEISRMWTALPRDLTHVDAVYERPDKKIAFFIGKELYLFDEVSLVRGYPKPLMDLGLPESLEKLDAAMVWGHNGKTYFYSGTMYWKYDENDGRVEPDYPRDMSMWKGVGYNIDSVFQWRDGKTYFFKGKGFWKFNDLQMRVEHERQYASASFWMGCPEERVGRRAPFRAPPAPESTLRSPAPNPAVGAAPRAELLLPLTPLLSTILLLYAKHIPFAY